MRHAASQLGRAGRGRCSPRRPPRRRRGWPPTSPRCTSIAARVMAGVGEPGLILPPGASPHGYALRPSEARLLQEADLVVWVGPALTPWLADPIATLAPEAALLTLEDAPGIATLPVRAGGPFEAPRRRGRGRPRQAHATTTTHEPREGDRRPPLARPRQRRRRGARDRRGARRGRPGERRGLRGERRGLRRPRPPRSAQALEARLAPLRGRPFIVFHDGYQYFEHAFGLPAAGSIALHDGDAPGTARIAAHPRPGPRAGRRLRLRRAGVRAGAARHGDRGHRGARRRARRLGATLAPGPQLYPALLSGLADGARGLPARVSRAGLDTAPRAAPTDEPPEGSARWPGSC